MNICARKLLHKVCPIFVIKTYQDSPENQETLFIEKISQKQKSELKET